MRKESIKITSLGSLLVMMYYTRYRGQEHGDSDEFYQEINNEATGRIEKNKSETKNYPKFLSRPILDKYIALYESKYFNGKESGFFVRADRVFPAVYFFISDTWKRKITVDALNFISCNYQFFFQLEIYLANVFPDGGFERIVEDFKKGMKKTLSSFSWWELGGIHRRNLKRNAGDKK